MEDMILPALRQGGYQWECQVKIGKRPGGGKHFVDFVVTKDGVLILVSSKWQEVSGTAEQKVPFEVICLIEAMKDGHYKKAYLILGGVGWSLRKFYIGGGLNEFIRGSENVRIVTLERFVATANQGQL